MKRLFFVLGFFVVAGCGTGYYDGVYKLHLTELELTTRFADLWPGASEIPGTNLVIRLPKMFEKVYNKNSIYSDDPHGEIDPERLNPPFLNPFPGLVNCYEVFKKDPQNLMLPIYLYTGIRVLQPEAKAALEQELLTKLKEVAPDAAWDRRAGRHPAGRNGQLEEDRSENAPGLFPARARQDRGPEAAGRLPALVVRHADGRRAAGLAGA